jgi:hypothetical protein
MLCDKIKLQNFRHIGPSHWVVLFRHNTYDDLKLRKFGSLISSQTGDLCPKISSQLLIT